MYAFIDLLNRILTFINSKIKQQKEEELQDEYSQINDDVEGYLSATRHNLNSGMYKPSGKAPTDKDL